MTPTTADNEIKALFNAAWEADLASASIPILWQGVRDDLTTTPDGVGNLSSWARCSVIHDFGENAAIGGSYHELGGLVVISVFTPAGYGVTAGLDLANIARLAFAGQETPNGVWFTGVTVRTIGNDGTWFQTNVTATFRYRS